MGKPGDCLPPPQGKACLEQRGASSPSAQFAEDPSESRRSHFNFMGKSRPEAGGHGPMWGEKGRQREGLVGVGKR